jgi:hypothetical protein
MLEDFFDFDTFVKLLVTVVGIAFVVITGFNQCHIIVGRESSRRGLFAKQLPFF